jgi:hypothetical protein
MCLAGLVDNADLVVGAAMQAVRSNRLQKRPYHESCGKVATKIPNFGSSSEECLSEVRKSRTKSSIGMPLAPCPTKADTETGDSISYPACLKWLGGTPRILREFLSKARAVPKPTSNATSSVVPLPDAIVLIARSRR